MYSFSTAFFLQSHTGVQLLRCSSRHQMQVIWQALFKFLYLDPLQNHPPAFQQPKLFPASEASHQQPVRAIAVAALWTGLDFVCLRLNTQRGHSAVQPHRHWGKPPLGLICMTRLNFHHQGWPRRRNSHTELPSLSPRQLLFNPTSSWYSLVENTTLFLDRTVISPFHLWEMYFLFQKRPSQMLDWGKILIEGHYYSLQSEFSETVLNSKLALLKCRSKQSIG